MDTEDLVINFNDIFNVYLAPSEYTTLDQAIQAAIKKMRKGEKKLIENDDCSWVKDKMDIETIKISYIDFN